MTASGPSRAVAPSPLPSPPRPPSRSKLLAAEALEEIIAAKRVRYETWRARELSGPDWGTIQRRVLTVLASAVLPAAAILFAASNGFSGRRMRESIGQPKGGGGGKPAASKPKQPAPASKPKELSAAAPVAAVADVPSGDSSESSGQHQHQQELSGEERRQRRRRGLLG